MNASLRPRVTVIIPALQSVPALRYALESVLWQSFGNFEVWIVSDHSDDGIQETINMFCDPRVIWQDLPGTKRNESALITEGIRRARGEYIAYLHPSDLWLPNHLRVLVDALDNHDYDVAYTIMQSVTEDNKGKAEIPLMMDIESVPQTTVSMHRKCLLEEFRENAEAGASVWFENTKFFKWATTERFQVGLVPMTTGVKFLQGDFGAEEIGLQPMYIDRLRKDPDFINRELSTMLIRAEYALNSLPQKKVLYKMIWSQLALVIEKLKRHSARWLIWHKNTFQLLKRKNGSNKAKMEIFPRQERLVNRPDITFDSNSERMPV